MTGPGTQIHGVSVKDIERYQFAGVMNVRAKVHFHDGVPNLVTVEIDVPANDETTLVELERLLIEKAQSVCQLVSKASMQHLTAMARQYHAMHDFGLDHSESGE